MEASVLRLYCFCPALTAATGCTRDTGDPDGTVVNSCAARITKRDLYIRVRIGSEYADVLAVKLTAPTLASLAEAARKKDSSLLLPTVVRFNGAVLSDDDDLVDFLPDVNVRTSTLTALVVLSARKSGRPAVAHGPVDRLESNERVDVFLASRATPAVAHETVLAPHQVMLSYNWGVKTATGKYDMQELVKCIAAELKSINLSVWMDVDKMNGVIIDTMAGAVKNCQVFVPVVTTKYQESPNCKLEFDYAVALKKSIAPVYAVEDSELHGDGIHMVTLPHIQARLASIFSKCRESLDFRSHADWDSQMTVLKREILAKLNSSSHDAEQSAVVEQSDAATPPSVLRPTVPAALPTSVIASKQSPATIDLAVSPVAVPARVSQAPSVARGTAAASTQPSASLDHYLMHELEEWLNPVSFVSDMAAYASQYVPGTREWAVDAIGKQFAGDANVVWLNGAAGVGKSLVAYLTARSPPSGFTLLSAFFCKHYDEQKNNAKQLVCRLVYDLASLSPAACHQLHSLMQQDKDHCKRNPNALSILDKPIVAFSSLFLELLPLLDTSSGLQSLSDPVSAVSPQATATRYLIVIDALDECGTQGDPIRNELLSLLASLNTGFSIAAAKLPPFVKILTTGRPEADIWRVMESLRTDSLEPTAAANIRDIELFVQHEVAHFPYSLGPQTDKCCQLLTEYSEYVFVAARVLCSQVRTIVDSNHGVDRLDLVALVANLSASLDDQYARILDSNIKRNDIADLDVYMKFMYVLLAAKIPLDCANIAVLTDLMPAGVQLIISKLHSLLLISPDGKVTVLHKSVKDFLTSQARCTVPAFHVSLVKANVFVAQRCLAVLNDQLHHNIFGLPSVSEPVQPKKQELLSKLSPAVRYSCLHWATHLLDAANLNQHEIPHMLSTTEPVITDFCTNKLLQWLEVMTVEKQLSQLMESCANLVKLMESVSGLEAPIQKLKPHNFSHTKDLHQVPDATGALAAAKDVSYTLITAGASYLSLARELLTDVARLAARFHPALDFNPLHIYQSALTFTPQQTKLCQLYHSLAGGKVTASPDLTWGPLVSSMFGHSDPVTSVAFNHDGSLIASGSRDKTVRVWNPLSGALVSEMKGHSHHVNSVAFNHDGSLIASGSRDKTVRLWNPLSGTLVSELKGHSDYVNSVTFNHDGSLIASGSSDSTVRVWSPVSGDLVSEIKGHSDRVNSVAFNHDGSFVASGSNDCTVQVWNPLSGALVSKLKGHSHHVNSVAFNHDGSLIATGCADETVRVWNPLSGALVSELKGHSHHVNSVAFNGSLIASGSHDSTVRVWNPLSGALVSELKGHSGWVRSVAFNHDGSLIASGSYDKTVQIWNPLSGALFSQLKGHSDYVNSVAFNHDGALIASGSADKTVRVWNTLSGTLVSELKGHSGWVQSVAFNHDSALIASGSADKTIRLWNPLSGALVSVLEGYCGGSVKSLAFQEFQEPPADSALEPSLKFSDNSGWLGLGSASSKLLWVPLAPSLEYAFSHSAFACGFPDGKIVICVLQSPK
ncbi:hypothetical protein HDU84_005712 [Entophlyctis sp. JEL0112]|nr:hypothetical protein HDU84_005712 [Entophlyctis sp. JEL0112]